ncbi:MAG TPA: hypothetical protein VMV46_10815 [Thermoanaerobaculia bacterium]|nr:hypothetical protein [Thermoanaerobaculia bacterium]
MTARHPLAPLLVGLAFGAGALWFALTSEVLYDTDAYYHLAIADLYATEGQVESLPWLRASVLGDAFGDKELLFHWLLAPFAAGERPELGGRVALALLIAAVATLLAALGRRAIGPWGLALAPLVLLGSIATLDRLIRLRPELLSLLLLVAATLCAARGRDRLLGLVALVYTLSYTAFHALIGLCGLWWLQQGLMRRRWRWQLLLYPIAGVGLGLVLHPDLPDNLVLWKVQNVDHYLHRSELDISLENAPASPGELLRDNLGWLAGLLLAWVCSRSQREPREEDAERDLFAVASLPFVALYLLSQRFSIYAIPFVTLALAFELRRRGRAPSSRVDLPRRPAAVPAWPFALLVAALVLAPSLRQLHAMATASGGEVTREDDWKRLARSLPAGVPVAVDWGLTPPFLLWGRQATYLNALDPTFMAVPYPEAYRAWRRIEAGVEPDVPGTLRRELDSVAILLSRFRTRPELLSRLADDPRVELFHPGYTLGYRLRDPGEVTARFAGAWRLLATPDGGADDAPALEWSTGFVRLEPAPAGCATVETEIPSTLEGATDAPGPGAWELSPWGPARVEVDGGPSRALAGSGAVLGRGERLELAPGARVRVESCSAGDPPLWGFYLVRR